MNIITTQKSRSNPSAITATQLAAIDAVRGIDRLLPVMHGRRVVGATFAPPWWLCATKPELFPDDVLFKPLDMSLEQYRKWAGFLSYDAIINAISTNGAFFPAKFSKGATTAPVANNWYDLWPVGGSPAAGAYAGAAFTAVQFSDATSGALYHAGNQSPSTKHLISMDARSTGGTPTLVLYDRVLTYEACTFNAGVNQAMTNTLAAQRYISAGQPGLKIITTCQTVFGATASNFTQLQYTDQAGNTLQSMPVAAFNAIIVSAAAPTATLGARVVSPSVTAATLPQGPFMPLAVGDGGVRLIANYTTSAANTGTMAFVLGAPLATIPIQVAGVTTLIDMVQQLIGLYRVFDGACLSFLAFFPAATASTFDGSVNVAWG